MTRQAVVILERVAAAAQILWHIDALEHAFSLELRRKYSQLFSAKSSTDQK